MKQVVIDKPLSVQIQEVPLPRIGPGEVLVKTIFSGVSVGTEKAFYRGYWGTPINPGYEAVGAIVACGKKVSGLSCGDKVICLGNHAEYVKMKAPDVARIPPGLGLEEATFVILGTTAAHAAERSCLKEGGSVAVVGLGVLGQMLLQYLRVERHAHTIGIDISPEKCRTAQMLGADLVINPTTQKGKAQIAKLAKKGVDVAVEVAGGVQQAVDTAMQIVREKGRVLVMGGGTATGGIVHFPYRDHFFTKELDIAASRAWGEHGSRNFRKTLRYLAQRKLSCQGIRITKVKYTEIGRLYDELREGKKNYFHVILEW